MPKEFNRRNFHKHTFCNWEARPAADIAGLVPDYKSKSGSVYYFTEEGVYRNSDHWARVANCKWRLEGATGNGKQLGYARWTGFHPDNDIEKLYYIAVDFSRKTATYEHKDNLSDDDEALLRNAPDTMKRIREIRKFLETDGWLAYYDGDKEHTREKVIKALIATDKPAAVIRTEILTKR